MKKVVLAYSGGLDTSVAVAWMRERYGYEVIALTLDVGQGKDLGEVSRRAVAAGAAKVRTLDARRTFLQEYVMPALQANAMYEDKYPLSSALSRPLIARALVEVAREEGAVAVAHGCTGKGNDQVRFDVSIRALAPDLEIIAPVREWSMSRQEEVAYARERGVPLPVTGDSPYSIDQNLWGRSIECGCLEDPWVEPPEEVFQWTRSVEDTPECPRYVEISFEAGLPRLTAGLWT